MNSASVIEQTVMVNGRTLIIYNNRKPDVYPYDELFFINNPSSGKYFPSVQSLVIKDDGSLWWVASRNESTFEFELKPCNWIQSDPININKVISYGNDRFCLYVDARTDPHKLVVDAKLLFYGNNLVEYALYRSNVQGGEECISMYLDATDSFKSNRIPMGCVSEEYPIYKFPTNCHTTFDLVEGEVIVLRVYNNLGNLAAEINLFVRNAVWWNDLNSHTNPIIKLDATCLQERGDDWFIFEKQDPSHLNITPYLMYADGTRVDIPVDNKQCFLYGLDDFVPGFPGYTQPIVLKYFLNARETSIGHTTANEKRFLMCEKKIVVVANKNSFELKVTAIPIWNDKEAVWTLRFFAYTEKRNAVYDITDLVVIQDPGFDGTYKKWGHEQKVSINYDLQSLFETDDPLPGAQDFYITVWDKVNHYECYTMRDTPSSNKIYGVDGSITRRPAVCWDRSINRYFIPTSIFGTWEDVLESFYYMSSPPFNSKSESKAPTPTHFTIRDPRNGQMIITAPIPGTEFGQAWRTIVGTADLVGGNVIVEFLQEVKGTMLVLYGVPVDVHPGTYNRPELYAE